MKRFFFCVAVLLSSFAARAVGYYWSAYAAVVNDTFSGKFLVDVNYYSSKEYTKRRGKIYSVKEYENHRLVHFKKVGSFTGETFYRYDEQGRLIRITTVYQHYDNSSDSVLTDYFYREGKVDSMHSTIKNDVNASSYEYDSKGRIKREVSYLDGKKFEIRKHVYDDQGCVTFEYVIEEWCGYYPKLNGDTSQWYMYDRCNRIKTNNFCDSIPICYQTRYDSLGRPLFDLFFDGTRSEGFASSLVTYTYPEKTGKYGILIVTTKTEIFRKEKPDIFYSETYASDTFPVLKN